MTTAVVCAFAQAKLAQTTAKRVLVCTEGGLQHKAVAIPLPATARSPMHTTGNSAANADMVITILAEQTLQNQTFFWATSQHLTGR